MRALLLLAPIALGCAPALRGEAAIQVAYLVAGGSASPGGKAPSTGGAAIGPVGRLLISLPVADPYVGLAPTIVAPQTLAGMWFVGAVDAGAAWHPSSRRWSLGTGATIAPSNAKFCNDAWCLREWLLLYGGEMHLSGEIARTEGGGGLTASLTARALTGRPTAWYWPSLTPEERDLHHWAFMVGGQGTWRF